MAFEKILDLKNGFTVEYWRLISFNNVDFDGKTVDAVYVPYKDKATRDFYPSGYIPSAIKVIRLAGENYPFRSSDDGVIEVLQKKSTYEITKDLESTEENPSNGFFADAIDV